MHAGTGALAALAALSGARLGPGDADAGAAAGRRGRVDITPANGGTTLGYVRPDITVKGVHTRLIGRALVLDDGDTKVALLATDLGVRARQGVARRPRRRTSASRTRRSSTPAPTRTRARRSSPTGRSSSSPRRSARADAAASPPGRRGGAATVPRRRTATARSRRTSPNFGIDLFYGQGSPEQTTRRRGQHARPAPARPARRAHRRHAARRVDGVPGPPDDLDARRSTCGTPTSPARPSTTSRATSAATASSRCGPTARRATSCRVFDSYNATATMDLLGRRIAAEAGRAWRAAGRRLDDDLPLDVRWTRACYCGQEVEPGRSVGSDAGVRACRSSAARRTARRSSTSRWRPRAGGCPPRRPTRCTAARSRPRRPSRSASTRSSPRSRCCGSATGCCSPRRASRASRWAAASRPPWSRTCRAGVARRRRRRPLQRLPRATSRRPRSTRCSTTRAATPSSASGRRCSPATRSSG